MADYIDNATVIKNTLAEAMSAATPTVTKQALQTFVNQLSTYLIQLEDFYNKVQNSLRESEMQYASCDNISNVTITYSTYKKLQYSDAEIDTLLKTGYTLIDGIRNLLTNETITYQIGTTYKGVLYETQLSIEEILKYTRVEYNTRSQINNLFKLRMYNKGELRAGMMQSENTLSTAQEGTSSIWSAVNEFVTAHKSEKGYSNKGNAYEVYRVLVSRNRGYNTIPPATKPTPKELDDAFSAIRSNTASSVKGGDYLSDQIKYFSSAPSITTTSLVRTTLTEIRDAFQQYLISMDNGALQNTLKNMFIKNLSQTSDKIEEEAAEQAEQALIEAIEKLGIKVTTTVT